MYHALAELNLNRWTDLFDAQFVSLAPLLALFAILYWCFTIFRRLRRDKRATEAQLAQAQAELAAAKAETVNQSAFIASLCHELRVPVSAILAFAESTSMNELDWQQREALERVLTSAEWLTRALSQVLELTRLEAAINDFDTREFSLADCVESAVKLIQPAAKKRGLDLSLKLAPDLPPTVIGDPGRLRQVLVNLIDNAVRFTTAGSVVVTVCPERAQDQNTTLAFSIADTGIGIPHEIQESIFQPFFAAAGSGGGQHAGLGLAICRNLIERMSGKVEVQSHVGAGSTFRFTAIFGNALPEPEHVAKRVFSHLPTRRLSVLVVDHEAAHRQFITKLLESAGHQVSPAGTGAAGSNLFGTDLFDLILVSDSLPDTGLLPFAQSIREAEEAGSRACMYGIVSPASPKVADSSGLFDGFLSKPLDVDDLMPVVQQVVVAGAVLHA